MTTAKKRTVGAGLEMTIIGAGENRWGEPVAVVLSVHLANGEERSLTIDAADMDAFAEAWRRERLRVIPPVTSRDANKG